MLPLSTTPPAQTVIAPAVPPSVEESARGGAGAEQEELDDLHGGDAVEVAGEGAADPSSDQQAEV